MLFNQKLKINRGVLIRVQFEDLFVVAVMIGQTYLNIQIEQKTFKLTKFHLEWRKWDSKLRMIVVILLKGHNLV